MNKLEKKYNDLKKIYLIIFLISLIVSFIGVFICLIIYYYNRTPSMLNTLSFVMSIFALIPVFTFVLYLLSRKNIQYISKKINDNNVVVISGLNLVTLYIDEKEISKVAVGPFKPAYISYEYPSGDTIEVNSHQDKVSIRYNDTEI